MEDTETFVKACWQVVAEFYAGWKFYPTKEDILQGLREKGWKVFNQASFESRLDKMGFACDPLPGRWNRKAYRFYPRVGAL